MTWQFTMEFSGITLLNLTKTGDDYKGVAYFSKGRRGDHRPFLYVPMDGLRNPDVYATPEMRKAFGLRVIAAPGGRYLLEVDLKSTVVSFERGLTSKGPIAFRLVDDAVLDWRNLRYSADIRALARKGNEKRSIDPTQASGTVVLPNGTLVSLPAPPPGDPNKVYILTAQEKGKEEVEVSTQPLADRHAVITDCTQPRTIIVVKKTSGKKELRLSFGPPDGKAPLGIAFSSNCAAGSGTPEELSDYAPLLKTKTVTFRMRNLLATDDHACVSAVWID